jgi:glycerophosphoryl diester phosphodiesterase
MYRRLLLTLTLIVVLTTAGLSFGAETQSNDSDVQPKWIISSGLTPPLPAGSLLGLALALERGGSSLWLDLVLTADDQAVLLSDTRIDELTDVKTIFPERSRPDGSYYSFDFTLDELQQLSLTPTAATEYTPLALSRSHLHITALDEFLSVVDLVSADFATPPTLIFVLKHGWRHQQEDKDLGAVVLETLNRYRTADGSAALMIGSYDPEELQQLAQSTDSGATDIIGFMQLIGADDGREVQRLEFGTYQPYSYDLLFTRFGLKAVSGYADTIGLDPEAIFDGAGELMHPSFLNDAHTLGLRVVCCRADALSEQLFNLESNPVALFEHLLFTIGFDGMVTSEDRRARSWIENLAQAGGNEQNSIIERLIDQIGESDGTPSRPVQSDTTR